MTNASFRSVFVCILVLLALSKQARADNILITVHPGSSQWWFALAVSDTSVTDVEVKDSSPLANWSPLQSTNWGYWVHPADGTPAMFPISVMITSPTGSLVFNNLFKSILNAGNTFNTHTALPTAAPTLAPTLPPIPAMGSVTMTQEVLNTWDGGSQYTVTIHNGDESTLTGISFTGTGSFVQVWSIQQNDNTFSFPSYVLQSGGVAPGATFQWGYVTDGDAAQFTIVSTTFDDTVSPPTSAPTTVAPTDSPTTAAPTTRAHTNAPTTKAPTTKAPTTKAPTTKAPSTTAPTTTAPATAAPTTKAPATAAPTTKAPATAAPTTKAPATAAPTTATPTTNAPATAAPSTAAPATSGSGSITVTGNPFVGAAFYSPPQYSAQVQATANANPSMTTISSLLNVPVAAWITANSAVAGLSSVLAGAKGKQASTGTPSVVTAVVYNLPSRDCAAKASNGEIQCADATCADGINSYKTQFIDPLVTVIQGFPEVRVAVVLEPDSLGNLVTNMDKAKCATAATAYKTCVAYAIKQLATLPNVAIYLDAAHGGWLGWQSNADGFATVVQDVLTQAGGANLIRGFATNTAGYQPLGSMTSTDDPCALESQYNFAINEVKYISILSASLAAKGITGKSFITDTSRNGVINARSSCSNWCNINKAGLGIRPVASPANLGVSNIDALLWVKPPGECDGTSDPSAARYDSDCSSPDSVTPAPEAGNWFPAYFTMLVQNANPPL